MLDAGIYGEGLKLAASYLTLNQVPVYLFTDRWFSDSLLSHEMGKILDLYLLEALKKRSRERKFFYQAIRQTEDSWKDSAFLGQDLATKLIAEERFPLRIAKGKCLLLF